MALSFSVFNKFKAIDGVTAPVRKMTKNVGRFGDKAVEAFRRADKASSKFGKKLSGIGKGMSKKMTLPITILGGVATKTAIDFETAWTGVIKTVNATDEELDILKKGLLDMTLKIPLTAEEIFGIAEAAGQLGIQQKDILGFTRVMADLGATTNITAAEAAMSLAKFANITDMAGKDIERLGSTIVGLGNNTATTEADIVEMGMRLAGAGKTIGLTQAQIMSLAASLSSVGLEAEAGGSAISMVMKKISKEIGSGSQKMDAFALIAGKSTAKFEKAWKEDAGLAIIDIIEGLGKLQKQGKNVNVILDGLGFSGIRISDALLRASGAGDKFRKIMGLGNKLWAENNALAKEAALRYDTAASKLIIAWNRAKQLAAAFGAILVPTILAVVKFLEPMVDWLTQLGPITKTVIIVIAALAAAIGPLLIAIGLIASGITAIIAIGTPIIATIAAITFAIAGIGSAIVMVIKHWDGLKSAFFDGLSWISEFFINTFSNIGEFAGNILSGIGDKIKGLTSGLIGKLAGFFGFDDEEIQQAQLQGSTISPNAGLANTIRQETENRSRVSVDFSNIPKGTKVKQDGSSPGFDLKLGYSGAW